ncbi:RND transporter MFP subunit [Hallella multisaccharivorax DSM 17128]|uniref:Efflux transporter, RND family, MFP subunit n=1 Tax=Hallella multisaccharivorax DSM 17128 TaxID=688246 RepID=F8NAN1_9BACT|nr:efflux RND transporter periplasmic adaptor subunit [Hallella multisaccharivorax]EGN55831.1 efflux transporter, RND family, MFP subunit [Hallella multisaccharivorax DSM 17128]GJG29328.1 RND transporter MFP subunit [Hallella multisaccharivorax DSM 17128]
MKKAIRIAAIVLVLIIFIGTFVFLWLQGRQKPTEYNEYAVRLMDICKTTVITGKIVPRNEVNVKPQISGIITDLYKQAGQTIQAGEVIAKVKVIPDESQLSAAQARVRLANINERQAAVDYGREKTLYDKGLVSGDEYDQKRKAYLQAREETLAATENLEVVRDGVSASNASTSSTLIRSTISGLILDVPVKVGNTVILSNTFNDGTTIATVANMNDLIFDGNIDETEVGSLRVGMLMKITIGAMQNERLQASLEYISPKATENNGANQFEIKAAVKVAGGNQIRSGYSANAEIVLAEAPMTLSVPESCILFEGTRTFVYVVKAKAENADDRYVKRYVTTGLSDGINIQIKSGLKKGETVRGQKKVKEEEQEEQ